jgi:23S rRNA (cytidine1920-2'-O)/16S rRNA (cytidine1409-2'-O)-methyltransferase
VREGVNARTLAPADFPEPMAFACVDVSFISLTLVLPSVTTLLTPGARLVTLIKPQFEAGRDQVGRGGVVRDEAVRAQVVETVRASGTGPLRLRWDGVCESPLRGPAGNVEFLACWTHGAG